MSQYSTSDGRPIGSRVDRVAELLDGVHILQLVGRVRRLEQQVLNVGHRRLSHRAEGSTPLPMMPTSTMMDQHFKFDELVTGLVRSQAGFQKQDSIRMKRQLNKQTAVNFFSQQIDEMPKEQVIASRRASFRANRRLEL